jgi:hypothetical protein
MEKMNTKVGQAGKALITGRMSTSTAQIWHDL